MSSLTGYTTGGVDLSFIFQPYNSGASLPTKYLMPSSSSLFGTDLCYVFQQLTPTNAYTVTTIPPVIVGNTGYTVNGADLSTIFAPINFSNIFQSISGNYTIQLINGYCVINFLNTNNPGGQSTVTSSFKVNSNVIIYGVNVICIAGGGGGGSSSVTDNPSQYGSGGGGGGIGASTTSFNIVGSENSTYVAQCGICGYVGTNGGGSTFANSSGNLIVCTGGSHGNSNNTPGIAGSCTLNVYGPTGTQNGGNGGPWGVAGGDSSTTIPVPTALSAVISSQYGGGGGGGNTSSGGNAGYYGKGVSMSGSYTSFNGQNGGSLGSGGGGAGGILPSTNFDGGYGGYGGCIMYFPMNAITYNAPFYISSGQYDVQLVYPYYVLIFNTVGSSTLVFTEPVDNVSVVCVAGGGAGGIGSEFGEGTGGAAGGACLMGFSSLNGTYTIDVGSGANDNMTRGNSSSFTSAVTTPLTQIICTGGESGNINNIMPVGGTYSFNGFITQCNGNGGYLDVVNNTIISGENSLSYTTPFDIPQQLTSTIPASYGGGGAAGYQYGGLAGSNGAGTSGSTGGINGINATTPGSGGGGGGGGTQSTSGGNGGNGVVYVFFNV